MKRWHWTALALLTILSLAAQFAAEREYWWEKIPAFWAVYGFVGCMLIIVIAKAIGKHFVQKKEDYYDES